MAETEFYIDKEALIVVASRIFEATPERLWRALTEREQIPKWWGPAQYRTVIDTYDFKVDGKWRFVQTGADQVTHAFHGKYLELNEPKKIVRTFEYEPFAGHILVETSELEPINQTSTKLKIMAQYENLEDLEAMVNSGMETGERDSFERLVVLVQS